MVRRIVAMDTTPEAQVVTAIDDTRDQPLTALSAAALQRRFRPETRPEKSGRVAVAAFNASL